MKIGITTKGLKEVRDKFNNFDDNKIIGIFKMGLYDGAGVGEKHYKNAIAGIPRATNAFGRTRISKAGIEAYIGTYPYLKWLHPDDEGDISGIPDYQAQKMVESVRLQPMTVTRDGVYNYVNVNGYDGVPTKKYPQGVPLRLILRTLENGKSFRQATNTVDHARKEMANSVRKAMRETITKEVKKELE